ncbi:MAG: phosphatidylserine decarboxylase [Solibacillus sp.]
MRETVYQRLIELTNGKASSNVLKTITASKMSKKLIRSYSNVYGINIEEVSKSTDEFDSLQQFFVRTLKEDARTIAEGANIFVSPVDAKVESCGMIKDDMTFTVKNQPYTLTDLLGHEKQAARYRNGQYIVFYLSPADYHRIHSPFNGTIVRQYVLGQKSYPVNRAGLTYGKKPISHNYRMVSEVAFADHQHFAFIKVGAMFVNSIKLTNTSTAWKKGEEVGYFSFGSTVVMLFEENSVAFHDHVREGRAIKMGEAFATVL